MSRGESCSRKESIRGMLQYGVHVSLPCIVVLHEQDGLHLHYWNACLGVFAYSLSFNFSELSVSNNFDILL